MGGRVRMLIAAVILGGTFGSASATVESINDEVMVIDIEVEVAGAPATVVAHLSWDNNDLIVPLLDRGDGLFGTTTELPARNYGIVFEAVGDESESSEATTLTQLGAELGPESTGTTAASDEDELSDESQQMLWLAVALGAASLSLIAFWVLGGSRDVDPTDEEE